MKFRKLVLRNWKNFTRVEVPISNRIFLVGPNASGKSNFLDVFRFLRDLASPGGGLQEAVARRGGVSAIRCLAARRKSHVEVGVEIEEPKTGVRWSYFVAFTQDRQRRLVLEKERVLRDGETILERPDRGDREDPARLRQTFLEQVNANRAFRPIAEFFASIRYMHIVPQIVREPERLLMRGSGIYGESFVEQVAETPERTRNARLRRIQKALQVAVPQLGAVELWRDSRGVPHLRGKYEHWRPHGAWQIEEQFSDGTLRLMGILWALMERGGPLLLEEPELSLHPGVIRSLPQMFARVQRGAGRQIFLSTHSPDLLRNEGIGLDEVFLLLPTREGTQVVMAKDRKEIRQLLEAGLTLADGVIPATTPQQASQLALFGGR